MTACFFLPVHTLKLRITGLQSAINAVTSRVNTECSAQRALSSPSQQGSHTQNMISCCSPQPVRPEHPWRPTEAKARDRQPHQHSQFHSVQSANNTPALHCLIRAAKGPLIQRQELNFVNGKSIDARVADTKQLGTCGTGNLILVLVRGCCKKWG